MTSQRPSTHTYKGYTAQFEIDLEEGIIHGKVLYLRDSIIFDGETVEEIKQSFHNAVDGYIEFCHDNGKEPEQPYSGVFNVRIDRELHRRVATIAGQSGKSLNQIMIEAVENYLGQQSRQLARRSKRVHA